MINDYHIRSFGWATQDQIDKMQDLTFAVNKSLQKLFF